MTINRTTIDQLLFDYFEGNLSEEEKAALLNFIHQHPEYEKDFSLWAQTYVCVDNTPQDYGLSASLLKETKPPITSNPWLYVALGALMLVSIWVFVPDDEERAVAPIMEQADKKRISKPNQNQWNINKTDGITTDKNAKPDKGTEVVKNAEQVADKQTIANTGSNRQTETHDNSELVYSHSENEQPTPQEVAVSIEQAATYSESTLVENSKLKQDSGAVKKTESTVPDAKKDKKQLPMDLKPKEKFLPVNPNF